MKIVLFFIRTYFGILSGISPKLASKHAFRLFQRPLTKAFRKREKHLYANAERHKIDGEAETFFAYTLGDPENDLVFMVHGWDSNAGSLGGIAEKLVEEGKYVVAFDLPAHGKSDLKYANIKTSGERFAEVIRHFSNGRSFSVVSHSFGSAVTNYTLWNNEFAADKLVMLTSPNRLYHVFLDYKAQISLGDRAFKRMLDLAKNLVGFPVEEVTVSKFAGQLKVNEMVIIHDRYDKIIPYENALAIQNESEKARTILMEKVGHYRMLWNEEVISHVALALGNAASMAEKQKDLQMAG